MLKVTLHIGSLKDRTLNNQLAVIDIAYQVKTALATYLVAMTLRHGGEQAPALVSNYPRWSASLWDLVARALTRVLYQADQAPASDKPDRRCAYATRICATIERATADDRGVILGTAEIAQTSGLRGTYTAVFNADLQEERVATFDYGCKRMNPADLLLRAICWSLYGRDQLGALPKLILPPAMKMDGIERFHLEALTEPAKTGFKRYLARQFPTANPEPLPKAEDYVHFLVHG